MSTPRHAVVLAAGAGTRAWPFTETRAKPLLPVGPETLVSRLLRQLGEAGIEEATVVAPDAKGPVADHAADAGAHHGLTVDVAVQQEARGTGHALQQADMPEEPVLVTNGDLVLPEGGLQRFVEAGETVLGAAEVDDVSGYGALQTEGGRVAGIAEKPDRAEPGLVNAGVYLLPPRVQAYLGSIEESPRGEVEFTDALEAAIGAHEEVRVHAFEDWLDVAWPWELLGANRRALDDLTPGLAGKVESGARVDGPVRVERGAVVRSGAVLEGPVLVRSGAEVGPNAYVRGATTIGPDAKVGHACEVKNSVLMAGAKVPHVSYVGDSVLGADVNLGAGTQVANLRHDEADIQARTKRGTIDTGRRKLGAVLGDGAKTGINATLNVGVVLGPGETVKPGETVDESRVDGES
jgi:bifunctional UDP-N-acetylglucosamine pyrophosphorylase/glucosamine-1-phosphate N-acetyltransferase